MTQYKDRDKSIIKYIYPNGIKEAVLDIPEKYNTRFNLQEYYAGEAGTRLLEAIASCPFTKVANLKFDEDE